MSQLRRAELAPERLAGWVERFAGSHGTVVWSVASGEPDAPADWRGRPDVWFGQADDGSWARFEGWSDADPAAEGPLPQAGPSSWSAVPGPLLLLLVRRGGYAVAVTTPEGELVAHKVGTRRVQGRTAAGGWSQQRFARRRANQADELVEAAVGHAARVLGEGEGALGTTVGALVVGGDPKLVDQALTDLATGPLSRLHGIPRRELRDLADPRRAVLDDAVRRALAVRVEVSNAG